VKLPRAQPRIMGVPVSIETARSLARATNDMMRRRFVPDDIKVYRMDICKACPSWSEASNRCQKCGCQMKVKVSLSSSECPLKKWPRHILDMRE